MNFSVDEQTAAACSSCFCSVASVTS